MNWHTKQEREVIRKHGGKPLIKYGYDGVIDGKPVEVRSVRKDHRYRIQKDVHQTLVRRKGSYIFCKGNKTKKVPAKSVSRMMGKGHWYKDRDYPHRFVTDEDVWG